MSITEDPPQMETTRLEPESPKSKRGSKTRTHQSGDIQFHGVRKRRWGRFVSEIRLPGKHTRIWLGSFGSPEMAARAHDSAAFFLKGDLAILNFPDSVTSLPQPESSSRRDIKLAAVKAALEPVWNPVEIDGSGSSIKLAAAKAALEPEENPVEIEKSGLGAEPDCSGWWGLVDGGFGMTSFEEAKNAPLLSPLRLDSLCGELYAMEMDDESLLASCFVFTNN